MIFGDPYKFAIQFDFVNDWIGLDGEGIFSLIVNGNYHPDYLPNQSITILDCFDSLNYKIYNLENKKNNDELFNLNKDLSFKKMNLLLENLHVIDEVTKFFEEIVLDIPEIMTNKNYIWILYSMNSEKIIFRNSKGMVEELIFNRGYCYSVIYSALKWAKKYYSSSGMFDNIV